MSFYINLNDYVPEFPEPESPVVYQLKHPRATHEMLGFLPKFLDNADPRPAKEQFQERYAHGGGWDPTSLRFTVTPQGLRYPGDPVMHLVAEGVLHGKETIRIYDCAWVSITQEDGTYEICRMD
jgi:hypothetical protein